MATACASVGDSAGAKWLSVKVRNGHKIFVVSGDAGC